MAVRRPCLRGGALVTEGSYCPACAPRRLRGRRWREIRAYVLMANNHTCVECGARNVPLEVHHGDGDLANNTPRNLIPLCVRCHHRQHAER